MREDCYFHTLIPEQRLLTAICLQVKVALDYESAGKLMLSTLAVAICYYCGVCRQCMCCKDDNWRSVNYQNEDSVHKFETDMKQLGFDDIPQYTHGQ